MKPYYSDASMTLYHGDVMDVLLEMPEDSVQCVVTSPPYFGLRDYATPCQIGREAAPDAYVATMATAFREVRRVLKRSGTCWLNLGDTMMPDKNEAMIPHRVVMALQADGWICRSTIIWAKPNPMPESVTDRPTKSHEYLFLLTKSARYYYDADAIAEPAQLDPRGDGLHSGYSPPGQEPHRGSLNSGVKHAIPASHNGSTFHRGKRKYTGMRGKRSVWIVPTFPLKEAHFATFPPKLIEPCVLAGSAPGDVVLDPFVGSGTTCLVARKHGRKAIGIDINADYLQLAIKRNAQQTLWFTDAAL